MKRPCFCQILNEQDGGYLKCHYPMFTVSRMLQLNQRKSDFKNRMKLDCRVATAGKVVEKHFFFSRLGKCQVTWQKFRGILNSTSKSVKGQGILFLSSHKSQEFLCWQRQCRFKKNICEGIDFCGFINSLIAKGFVLVGHDQPKLGFIVSESQETFFYPDEWQCCRAFMIITCVEEELTTC